MQSVAQGHREEALTLESQLICDQSQELKGQCGCLFRMRMSVIMTLVHRKQSHACVHVSQVRDNILRIKC